MSSVSLFFFFFFAHLQQSGLSEQLGHRHTVVVLGGSFQLAWYSHPPALTACVRASAGLLNLLPSCESLAPISK